LWGPVFTGIPSFEDLLILVQRGPEQIKAMLNPESTTLQPPTLSTWGLWATKLRDRATETAVTIKSSVNDVVSDIQSSSLPLLESLAARASSRSTCSLAEDDTSFPSTSSPPIPESVLGCTTVETKMEDLNLTTPPDNGVAATGPPQKYFNLVAVINHMQWLLNCDSNRSLLGPHLVAFCRDVISMAETMSVLTADPHVLAYTLGHERILRALTLQNQLGQLLAQMEERPPRFCHQHHPCLLSPRSPAFRHNKYRQTNPMTVDWQ
jgi:hypothetical protein